MRLLLAFVFACAPLTIAHAQAMPVSQFLTKADALQKKGPLALLSGDLRLLKAEITESGKQLRAEQAAARKAGRKPLTCLPEKAAVNSQELINHFRAIPPAQRNIPVKTAFASLMRAKYPCPA